MIWELRLLGLPIISIKASESPVDERSDSVWGGGTGGEFERDTEPLRADRQEPYYEEDRFGFQ